MLPRMDLRFLFRRPGMTIAVVAAAAGVHQTTAWRWREGAKPDWDQITRLHGAGLLTDADLRAAGLAIPLPDKIDPAGAA